MSCRLSNRPVIAERMLVGAVHVRELAHVDQEHAAAKHVRQARAGRFENRLNVSEALFGLRLDVRRKRARRRIDAALARDEHEPLESHAG